MDINKCEDCIQHLITKSHKQALEKANKAFKVLQEIKEIAENAKKDICSNCGWRNTDSCEPEDYTCGEFIKILQKISEVNDGYDMF